MVIRHSSVNVYQRALPKIQTQMWLHPLLGPSPGPGAGHNSDNPGATAMEIGHFQKQIFKEGTHHRTIENCVTAFDCIVLILKSGTKVSHDLSHFGHRFWEILALYGALKFRLPSSHGCDSLTFSFSVACQSHSESA